MFPSLTRQRCVTAARSAERRGSWRCTDTLPSGETISFHYTWWKSVAAARAEYDGQRTISRETLADGRVQWYIAANDGQAKSALVYGSAPWGVTVYAPTDAALEAALSSLLEMRPARQVNRA